jgi:hypothetical protein
MSEGAGGDLSDSDMLFRRLAVDGVSLLVWMWLVEREGGHEKRGQRG